jgi:hypothetical protein
MSAYYSLVGVQTALKRGMNITLEDFRVPEGAIIRPLLLGELRLRDPVSGRICIFKDGKLIQDRVSPQNLASHCILSFGLTLIEFSVRGRGRGTGPFIKAVDPGVRRPPRGCGDPPVVRKYR